MILIKTYKIVQSLTTNHFFTVPGQVMFKNNVEGTNQSEEGLKIKLVRKSGLNGRIIVPWSVTSADDDSIYKV